MFSKKGKRKIVVDENIYYWGVKDNGCCSFCNLAMTLNVFSEDKYFMIF